MATTTALALGGLAVGAAGSVMSAQKANSNARRTARAAKLQAEANSAYTTIEYNQRKKKLAEAFSQYNKSATASAGIRGVGETSSTEAIRRASLASALSDQYNLDQSESAAQAAIAAQEANITNQAASSMQSPLFSGIMGGLGGLQSGLSLASSLENAGVITSGKKDGP